VKGKDMSTETPNFFVRLAQANEVKNNLEQELKQKEDFYALGVKRMTEMRSVYE
jgi:hypothetical protein